MNPNKSNHVLLRKLKAGEQIYAVRVIFFAYDGFVTVTGPVARPENGLRSRELRFATGIPVGSSFGRMDGRHQYCRPQSAANE